MANYSFQNLDLPDGSVINEGNFTQLNPHTEIMVGKTLVINGGNFTNVKKQPTWTINGGNWTQLDRCSHLHPEYLVHGLAQCGVSCSHLVGSDTVQVAGVTMETIYRYEDKVSQ